MVKNNFHTSNNNDKQIAAMKHFYPKCTYIKREGQVIFTFWLKVLDSLPEYKVKIIYQGNLRPKVFVLSPKIVDQAKHTYKDGSLCLYHDRNFKWSSSKLIAKNIVGWTAAWIYFYEYWLQTGKWIAKEVPHSLQQDKTLMN
jgi:hypothetical protein